MDLFALVFIAFYVGHHVGDYWVQTDWQAANKGCAGTLGRMACLQHVSTYVITQGVVLGMAGMALMPDWMLNKQEGQGWGVALAMLVSGITHYMADRREHGVMFKLARKLNLGAFMKLGVPRQGYSVGSDRSHDDNPQLATGAWALDQSWHLFFGVFVPALIVSTV